MKSQYFQFPVIKVNITKLRHTRSILEIVHYMSTALRRQPSHSTVVFHYIIFTPAPSEAPDQNNTENDGSMNWRCTTVTHLLLLQSFVPKRQNVAQRCAEERRALLGPAGALASQHAMRPARRGAGSGRGRAGRSGGRRARPTPPETSRRSTVGCWL